ncbi:unnamed protein product [Prorocentrum cordatum]|uniref:J domain-containing protein n=1 Tax=Prorocentrum cordatum TaxID=2364126 RepID=A0ABN9WHE2_9DINO|nr:unnamed protein product [Polarella glacialis]
MASRFGLGRPRAGSQKRGAGAAPKEPPSLAVSGAAAARAAVARPTAAPPSLTRALPKAREGSTGGSAARPPQGRRPAAATPPAPEVAAATRVQAWFRGVLGRHLAARQRARVEQARLEEAHERALRAKREAAAAARREAEEAKAREARARQDAQLRSFRDRRCAAEEMLQALPGRSMDWEESSAILLELLAERRPAMERWLGGHESRRGARKRYLLLARRWHPDKWALHGEHCAAVATDVTKCLVRAYEEANRELPRDAYTVTCDDEDEDREVYEFASWVGISFDGMVDEWKKRKGVAAGR